MIFVDTWAWLAIAYAKDPYHAAAVRQHQELRRKKRRYVTSDFVLSELISVLFGVLPFGQAKHFMDNLFQAFQTGRYHLVFVTAAQFQAAYQLRVKYHDKPDISFVDLTSMVVMQDLGITEVFTGDAHFLHVGMGFQLVP